MIKNNVNQIHTYTLPNILIFIIALGFDIKTKYCRDGDFIFYAIKSRVSKKIKGDGVRPYTDWVSWFATEEKHTMQTFFII